MTIHQLEAALNASADATLHIMLPDGDMVPPHFHVTEVGRVQKDFIDCGGTTRSSVTCLIQTWVATDTDHRLTAGKLANILRLAQPLLRGEDLPVELEYEGSSISQYPLAEVEITPGGVLLNLGSKHTDCLAKDRCGIPVAESGANACTPGAGCC